jgi:hypothetical protein
MLRRPNPKLHSGAPHSYVVPKVREVTEMTSESKTNAPAVGGVASMPGSSGADGVRLPATALKKT